MRPTPGTTGLVFLLALCVAASASAQATGSAIGDRAPALTLERLDGKPLDLGDYIGRTPMLLHFFAAWCGHCRAQMPSLDAAVARYGEQVKFVGVAVSAGQTLERARGYAQAHGMTHDLVYDARGAAIDAYDVPTTSYVVVVDRTGKIVFTGSGPALDFSAAVRKAISD
jgi:peroxiredoxin